MKVTHRANSFGAIVQEILSEYTIETSMETAAARLQDAADANSPLMSEMVAAVQLYVKDDEECELLSAVTKSQWVFSAEHRRKAEDAFRKSDEALCTGGQWRQRADQQD